jgi:hypothetical protein
MIPFAEWRPDIAAADARFTANMKNVLPGQGLYRPHPSLVAQTSNALGAACKGIFEATKADGSKKLFAATATDLFEYASGSWTSRKGALTLTGPSGNDTWSFIQFGPQVVAHNLVDAPVYVNVDTGTNFAAVPDSPPKARYSGVLSEFLFLGNLDQSGTKYPRKVAWSAIGDIGEWTPGTNLADEQDFPDGGQVQGIVGGEQGYIVQRELVRAIRYVPGSTYSFAFDVIEGAKGCMAPRSIVQVGTRVFYLSDDGFYTLGGDGLGAIGRERVNQWFFDNADASRLGTVHGVADPRGTRIYWQFYASAAATQFDRALIYDWQLNQWSWAEFTASMLTTYSTGGVDLDDITTPLDSLSYSLDSVNISDESKVLAGLDSSRYLSTLSGGALEAIIETAEAHPTGIDTPGNRAFIRGVYPRVDTTDAVAVSIAHRERLSDNIAWSAERTTERTGIAPFRVSTRLARIKVRVPANETWTYAAGVDVDLIQDGRA